MLRLRRYRVFIVFALIAVGLLYHFRNIRGIEDARTASVKGLKNFGGLKDGGSSKGETEPEIDSKPYTKDTSLKEAGTDSVDTPTKSDLDKEPYAKNEDVKDSVKKVLDQVTSTIVEDSASTSPPSVASAHVSSAAASLAATPSPSTEATQAPSSSSKGDKSQVAVDEEHGVTKDDDHAKAAPVAASPKMDYESAGKGRLEVIGDKTVSKIHWEKQKEHFPVPSESLIQLPTGKPKAIPKIQHSFLDESPAEKIDREKKLATIKKTFEFSWAGYRKNAWMHDELSPVSGQYRDPFCGWAATLVDSLDTLWMMGLKSEFQEAVDAVGDIDFTTSIRNDIPIFETVIRYLGGLIAAYDLGGSKYKILLDKAVELAEILIGAFDTPNRMPMTFYLWKPTFASQPHRANTRVVLAEIGSLSVEFTRLAQITKEAKYYDAIARISNEFEMWQNNTRMPGLWPKKVDASGCKKEDTPVISPIEHSMQKGPGVTTKQKIEKLPEISEPIDDTLAGDQASPGPADYVSDGTAARDAGLERYMIKTGTGNGLKKDEKVEKESAAKASRTKVEKRQVESDELAAASSHPKPDCKPQGLNSPPFTTVEEFTIGGQADSVYEYLPKQYLLLGGLEPQYQTMYEAAAETINKYLIFRPMIPEEQRKILFAGDITTSGKLDDPKDMKLKATTTHLACFAGGMFGMGAKIFDREDDLELAKQLTDACIWAYESTTTGIMPEGALVLPCQSRKECAYNETRYWQELDPFRASRTPTDPQHQAVLEEKKAAIDQKPKKSAGQAAANIVKAEQDRQDSNTVEAEQERQNAEIRESLFRDKEEAYDGDSLVKRQLGDIQNDFSDSSTDEEDTKDVKSPTRLSPSDPEENQIEDTSSTTTEVGYATAATATSAASGSGNLTSASEAAATEATKPDAPEYTPPPIPTQEEYAQARIRDERLPPGMTRITESKYILRPEAIESVFIMWRITGDVYWREKGWAMFEAIHRATAAEYGASAIGDVTSETPYQIDEMESFWLAETLKYFYLLFSDPSLISLDDYVLNTEAHPFKRPK